MIYLIPLLFTSVSLRSTPVHNNHLNTVVNGTCDVFSYNDKQRVKCIVIDFGDGGYVTNVNDDQIYVNEGTNKMYINGTECMIPSIKSNRAAVSSICTSSPDAYTIVMPTINTFN